MRAVLDANVFISALLSPRGTPARLIEHWIDGAFELVVSEELLEEVSRTLASRKLLGHVEPGEVEPFVALLRHRAEMFADPPGAPAVPSADRSDDYLLVVAAAADARLVSGDQHLLALADRAPVLSPREFLSLLET